MTHRLMNNAPVASFFVCLALLSSGATTHAQASPDDSSEAPDLRRIHAQAVYSMVQIQTSTTVGTGWLLAQTRRPVVITNKHVADTVDRRGAIVLFYRGSDQPPASVRGVVTYRSQSLDLAILRLEADPPNTARPLAMQASTNVVRGERVVLAGNPGVPGGNGRTILPFQTTEGVATGHIAGPEFTACGAGRNCVVVDAASLGGNSGGPVFNIQGQLVGMLWGGPVLLGADQTQVTALTGQGAVVQSVQHRVLAVENPAFAYLIHTRAIADELRALEVRRRR